MKLLLAAAFVLAPIGGASAQEWILGLGAEEVASPSNPMTAALSAEVHTRPQDVLAGFDLSWGAAMQIDREGDIWVGLGLAGKRMFGERFFVEASFMPGYYHQAPGGTNLGYPLEFRSLIGVGFRLNDRAAVSLAFDHRSNGGLAPVNPGVESLTLRYHRSF